MIFILNISSSLIVQRERERDKHSPCESAKMIFNHLSINFELYCIKKTMPKHRLKSNKMSNYLLKALAISSACFIIFASLAFSICSLIRRLSLFAPAIPSNAIDDAAVVTVIVP